MVAKILNIRVDDLNPLYSEAQKRQQSEKYKNIYSILRKSSKDRTPEEQELYDSYHNEARGITYYKHTDQEIKEQTQKILECYQNGGTVLPSTEWLKATITYPVGQSPIVHVETDSDYWDGLNNDYLKIVWFNVLSGRFETWSVSISESLKDKYVPGKYYNNGYIVAEADADEKLIADYQKFLHQKQLEKAAAENEEELERSKREYFNSPNPVRFATKNSRSTKNPFKKDQMGYNSFSGSSEYGHFNAIIFNKSDLSGKRTSPEIIFTSSGDFKPYIPTVEVYKDPQNDLYTTANDEFGLMGKNFSQYVWENLFKANGGLDLRNYPFEVFDLAICETLEYLKTQSDSLITDATRIGYGSGIPVPYSEFKTKIVANYEQLFKTALQHFDNGLHEALEEYNRKEEERKQNAATKTKRKAKKS